MELQVFENKDFGKVRTVQINNEPWFVGKDVCDCLGYSNSRSAIKTHVDVEDKGCKNIDTLGGTQSITVVNESGLYSLIFGSELKKAKEFRRWVTSEVIPSIRKHGAYMTKQTIEKALASPDFLIKLAIELKQEKQKRLEAEQQIERDRPLVVFGGAVSCSDTCILVGELAKLLRQNGVNIGQNRLFKWLRDNGYLIKNGSSKNMPTQRAMEMGLFTIKEGSYVDSNGVNVITKTPKVTGKGQIYFLNKFLSMKDKPLEAR